MMTATATTLTIPQAFVSPVAVDTQNETRLTDMEILRRVRNIRSSWTAAERLDRRQEAGKRFASLIEALDLDHQAA